MNYLIFDTETTGLPSSYSHPKTVEDAEKWPRIVQLAFMVIDEHGNELHRMQTLIEPDGWEISEEATMIHGKTTLECVMFGLPIGIAIKKMVEWAQFYYTNEPVVMVGHNLSFDIGMLASEALRCGFRVGVIGPEIELLDWIKSHPTICTMLSSTKYCNIHGKRGPKWPKLEELHRKLFDCDFDNAHDAMGDVLATAKCFMELKKRGIV